MHNYEDLQKNGVIISFIPMLYGGQFNLIAVFRYQDVPLSCWAATLCYSYSVQYGPQLLLLKYTKKDRSKSCPSAHS